MFRIERIKKHEGKVYYWELIDRLKPTQLGFFSAKLYVEANCVRFGYRYLNQTYYDGSMASGTISSSYNTPDKDWTYPAPNTPSEAVLNAVCNHTR